jgi:hypothetical protein
VSDYLELTRLTLPLKFKREGHALAVCRDNSLFTIGAQVIEVKSEVWEDTGTPWRVVIETARPDAVLRYLRQHMPGVTWERAEPHA